MRKIEEKMLEAIRERKKFCLSNTIVEKSWSSDGLDVLLHGVRIATVHTDGSISVTNCEGWRSNTTKSRLNAILSTIGTGIYQRDFQWYYSHDKSPFGPRTLTSRECHVREDFRSAV